ncbi:DUF4082 domain-containing protein [Hamadaea tsunoensis]|uniref:DUF4082 domain-containing protein n=1 Tax=Hamadaea tsunoensis TaxID=53368 RepID=UPI001B7FBCD0|nr:DUF4082 domain-containing protein [Hamadaea tsunoensis]
MSGSIPAAADSCLPNPVACENAKPGVPESTWDVVGSGDPSIQGFATQISVTPGGQEQFKVKTDAHAYTITIYRLGWYNGDGARQIDTVPVSATLPQTQPACITSPATEIYDCGNWGVSATWNVPSTAVSGVYIAKLIRTDNSGDSLIPFIVRDDTSHSDMVFQTSDTTWHAYNTYGGSDFYQGAANGRAYKLSYNRPITTRGQNNGRDFLFANEYPMIRFLERNGYDVSYISGLDTAVRGNLLTNHKVFLSVGHDEYWAGDARTNVEHARDAGVNLAFFSGNEVYWKTRWEPSVDGTNTANRTMVSYKETWANAKIDPSSEWTGTWRDPRFTPPSNGARPENQLTGTAYVSNSDDIAMQVTQQQGLNRFWNYTTVENLTAGTTATLAAHTVGYESDEDLDNGFRPGGLIWLTTTTAPVPQYLHDFGNDVQPGTTTHHMTLYKAPSGALVFSAGSIQYTWGLDQDHDGPGDPADVRIQQSTVNLFADMHVQPTSLMGTLHAATASADGTAPTATITSPAAGASMANGAKVTLSGTATDAGGGVVAGVEVSTDGGSTWHAATGQASWSYAYYAAGTTTQTVLVRAMDDSANIQPTPTSRAFTITGASSLFGQRVPTTPADVDGSALTLGVRFTPQVNGTITGIRFYKGTGNTGTHVGTLWSNTGTQLATGTFTGETSTGWQTLTFSTPVSVTAGATYVASYYAPSGHYAEQNWYFSYGDYTAYPLTATRSFGSSPNGLYRAGNGFPTSSYSDTNYYVDVLFSAGGVTLPTVIATTPTSGSTMVAASVKPTATFNIAVNPATISFEVSDGSDTPVAGTTTYDAASKTATFTPSANLAAGTAFTATVDADDTLGHSMAAPAVWNFTTSAAGDTQTLFASNAVPTNPGTSDSNSVELGVKFSSSTAGQVVGIRFYKDNGNTGTHIGNLWSSTGTKLASATFTNETASGWQYVQFSSPVTVTPGTTYVASYFAPSGDYAADGGYFASALTNGDLSAPSGTNGVYHYGSDAFPTDSWNSTNYWVDPVFVAGTGAPAPSPSPSPSAPASPSPSPSPSATGSPAATVGLFPDTAVPTNTTWNDNGPIEVGVQFKSSVAGKVTGVQFYKGTGNTGTHTARLWSSTGTQLASATFSGETASGWQTVTFSAPVTLTVGTTYVVSVYEPAGHYSLDSNYFASAYTSGALSAPATSNGLFLYGATGFPTSSYNASNYWVDVVFQPV